MDLGAGVNIGVNEHIDEGMIYNALTSLRIDYELRCRMAKRMKMLFDTQGSLRICRIIEQNFLQHEKNDKVVEN